MQRIILIGLPGSGKSTVAAILQTKFGLHSVNIGDILLSTLTLEGISCETRADIGPIFLKYHKESEIFEVVVRSVNIEEVSIIDGVRLLITCKQFLEWDPSIHIWYIDTEDEIRALRTQNNFKHEFSSKERNSPDRYNLYDNSIKSIKLMADVIIENNDSLSDLERNVVKRFKMSNDPS